MIPNNELPSQRRELDGTTIRMQIALHQLLSSFQLDVMYTKAQTQNPREFQLGLRLGLRSDDYSCHTMHLPFGQGGWAWTHSAPVWTNDYFRDNRFQSYRVVEVEGIRSILCVPFVKAGFLIYGAKRSQNAFSEDVARLLIEAIDTLWMRTQQAIFSNELLIAGKQPAYRSYDCSEREWNILYLLTLGLSDEEMAEILHIEASTIRFHLRRLQRKLECRNRTHLATTALRLGIVV
jgi:DNA-binding CsgD family transcriptional regulator